MLPLPRGLFVATGILVLVTQAVRARQEASTTPVPIVAQATGTSSVSGPKDKHTFLIVQTDTKAALEAREGRFVVAALRNREELAKCLLSKAKDMDESARKELESKLIAVLGCKELDWKKQMVIIAFESRVSRSPRKLTFTALDVKGKTLRVEIASMSELNTAGGRGQCIAIVGRVEALDTITMKEAKGK